MKLKKVLAMVLAATMIMGMSVTTFAADETSISVETAAGALTEATLTKLQVIGADPSTETGWKFLNGAGIYYMSAFEVDSEQEAIWSLIKYELTEQDITDYSEFSAAAQQKLTSAKTISAGDLDRALSKVYGSLRSSFQPTSNPITAESAGVYAIHASDNDFTYKMMAAYIGFTVADDGSYPTLPESVKLTEKGAPVDITKTGTDTSDGETDTSNVVAIGDIVTYEITTVIPFIDSEAFLAEPAPFFNITDEIVGAEYVLENGYTIEYTDVEENNAINAQIVLDADKAGFTVNLSDELNAANTNAGRPIKITYQAKITDLTTNNTAKGHIPGKDIDTGENDDNFVTGSVQLKKVDADDQEEVKKGLAGAEFQVKLNNTGNPLMFALEDPDVPGVYVYAPEEIEGVTRTDTVVVNEEGIVLIKGLDTGSYHFIETKAPNGYSINEDGRTLRIDVPEQDQETVLATVEGELADTKLSSLPLPSTGGIGTTIFTIGGCAIMIAAAGLYFASRRKQENK